MRKSLNSCYAILSLVIVACSAPQEPEKYAGPKEGDPFTGKWSHAIDSLHFADLEFFADKKFQLYLPLDKVKSRSKSEIEVERELLKGTYTILNRANINRPNGRWTEVEVQMTYTHSTCGELRQLRPAETRKVRFYYMRDGSERLYWGYLTTDAEFAQYERYNADDVTKKDSHKGLSTVKKVILGCFIDGRFVRN